MPSTFENLYLRMPEFIQNGLTSLYGFKRERQRYGGSFKKWYEILLKTQYYSESELNRFQFEELKSLLLHCSRHVPYYKNKFTELNFYPEKMVSLHELNKIPILDKETIRQNIDLFVANNFNQKELIEFHTSGTTGKSMKFYYEIESFRRHQALLERQRNWAGVKNGKRVATFTGRIISIKKKPKTFWRYNYFGNQLYFSTYYMSEKNLRKYYEKLVKFSPVIIEGYPSAIYLIAKWILSEQIENLITPQAILTTGETLPDYQREIIEEAFKLKVYNYYSSSEGAPFISQCEYGNYHLNLDSGIFEVLNEENKAVSFEDEIGRLVVTSFSARGTPLIRYDIGDSVSFSGRNCSCKRNFPVVNSILGRMDDMLYTSDRGYIGRLSPAIKAFPNSVKQVQLVQNSIDLIDMFYIPDKSTFKVEHLNLVLQEIQKRTGTCVQIIAHEVSEIKPGPNNKIRLTIRNFKPSR